MLIVSSGLYLRALFELEHISLAAEIKDDDDEETVAPENGEDPANTSASQTSSSSDLAVQVGDGNSPHKPPSDESSHSSISSHQPPKTSPTSSPISTPPS